jgi:hypothetical protein
MNARYIASLAFFAATFAPLGILRAGVIELFEFNDADGTIITAADNTGPGDHPFLSENTAVNSTVQNGAFRIQKETPGTQIGNPFDIDDISTGKIWLVADIRGWSYTETASSPSERVRFAFLDNANPSAGSNTITAQMNLDRNGGNTGLSVSGDAGGATSTATIAGVGNMPFSSSTNLRMALMVDADANTYSVYSRYGVGGPVTLVGTGNLGERSVGVIREPRSVRFAFTGTYIAANGEYVDVERIFVTDMSPIPEPASVALVVLGGAALLVRRRRRI